MHIDKVGRKRKGNKRKGWEWRKSEESTERKTVGGEVEGIE